MTQEREVAITIPTLYPISGETMEDSIWWLEVLRSDLKTNLGNEKAVVEDEDTVMAAYLNNMLTVRKGFILQDDEALAYQIGTYFGLHLIGKECERKGLARPNPNTTSSSYFESLFLNPEAGQPERDALFLGLLSNLPTSDKSKITPAKVARMMMPWPAHLDELRKQIGNRFHSNSEARLELLLEREDELSASIRAIKKLLVTGIDGFAYGIADVYWPHQMDNFEKTVIDSLEDNPFWKS